MEKIIKTLYFSPTGTTKQIVEAVASGISEDKPQMIYDITLTNAREQSLSFNKEDLLIVGVPVYGGRVPTLIESYLETLRGNDTPTIFIAVYGNRHYDDALLELKNILEKNGFIGIAAGAFIGEHSYTKEVATNRPDAADLSIAGKFGKAIKQKLNNNDNSSIEVKGKFPYKEKKASVPVAPITHSSCIDCAICADSCPTRAIDYIDFDKIDETKCIKCNSCVKKCPVGAKSFVDETTVTIINFLLDNCVQIRREPELFI